MATFFLAEAGETPGCHPLTLTRSLGDFPLANIPLRRQQAAALLALGLSEAAGADADLTIHASAWFSSAELATFVADASYGSMTTAEGVVLVARKSGGRELRTSQSFAITYAWDLLRANVEAMTARKTYAQESGAHATLYVDGRLQVGKGTKILPGVVIEGDVIIGDNCKVGPNCYIRGSTSIGDKCHVGQAVEIKNSILLPGTNVGHLSYLGDSILGEKVNFGAGTITSNLRHDGGAHRSPVAGRMVDTGRRKLGAIVGDGVHTGIHTSIYPGRKLWPKTSTLPGAIVDKDILS
jgi:UDP-N-acetylglucosamine diphosphorylase / glucose-1-phosphate thymidylyltransferase / UDP-N-acetylgalactosamine diphosphorylase / glucosamine-1-phosphate N-acetyltransferase / galactosamine-1-phosphate N-acetyltransferase